MDNVRALAAVKHVPITEITACVLDRPRHAALIEDLRVAGVAVKLISDGDVFGADVQHGERHDISVAQVRRVF